MYATIIRQLLFMSIVLALSSCATTYVSPGPSQGKVFLRINGNPLYVIVDEHNTCKSRQAIKKVDWLMNVYVSAGNRVYLEQGAGGSYYACDFAVSFIPQAGYTYVSEYLNKGLQCTISVRRVNDSGQTIPEPTFREEKLKTWCL
jgi:hypothetical protein